jgi:hypothetical protein
MVISSPWSPVSSRISLIKERGVGTGSGVGTDVTIIIIDFRDGNNKATQSQSVYSVIESVTADLFRGQPQPKSSAQVSLSRT